MGSILSRIRDDERQHREKIIREHELAKRSEVDSLKKDLKRILRRLDELNVS